MRDAGEALSLRPAGQPQLVLPVLRRLQLLVERVPENRQLDGDVQLALVERLEQAPVRGGLPYPRQGRSAPGPIISEKIACYRAVDPLFYSSTLNK